MGKGRDAVVFVELSARRRYVSRSLARLRFFARRVCGRVAYRRASHPSFVFLGKGRGRSFLSSYPPVGGTLVAVRVYVFSPRRFRTPCFRSRSYRRASLPPFAFLGEGRGVVVFVELSNRRRARLRFLHAGFAVV